MTSLLLTSTFTENPGRTVLGVSIVPGWEEVAPRQLSHQWCDFLVVAIGLVDLPHSQETPG